jgi:hypothetical protein
MPWPEAQIDELLNQVQRDFALGRFHTFFTQKLRTHGVTMKNARKTIGKQSYIGRYQNNGGTIGLLNPRNNVLVTWSTETNPTYIKTCFIAKDGLDYLLRQDEIEILCHPNEHDISRENKHTGEKRAKELLTWLISCLPGAVPSSPEEVILDVADEVHALFWHRSELQKIIESCPEA